MGQVGGLEGEDDGGGGGVVGGEALTTRLADQLHDGVAEDGGEKAEGHQPRLRRHHLLQAPPPEPALPRLCPPSPCLVGRREEEEP